MCHESFTRNYYAQAHIKRFHQNELNVEIVQVQNEKIAKIKVCQICNKTFGNDNWKLRRHEKTHIKNGEL